MLPSKLRQTLTATAIAAALAAPSLVLSGPAVAESKAKAKAEAAQPEMAPKMAKPKVAEQKKGDAAKGSGTQTAQSAKPAFTRLAQLVRAIEEHIRGGEQDGSLTKAELARLGSLKERVEIMDRLTKNDERVSGWERRYLETANEILQRIVLRERLDRQMSALPKHVELRIQRGLEDGTLIQSEAEKIREAQIRILRAGREAKEDGVVTRKERRRVLRAQLRLSQLLNHMRRYGPVKRAFGQANFKSMLERGVRNGSFSRHEARVLWFTNQRLRALRKRATADGQVSTSEIALLNRKLQEARYRLSYSQQAAYRRSLRTGGRGANSRGGRSGRSNAGSDAAHQGAAAARQYGRSIGRGMRSLNRMYGGK